MKKLFLILLVGLSMLCVAQTSKADGLLLINGIYRQPLSSHVTVTIKDKIATTLLEQRFQNKLDQEVSATYVAPVPDGATVTGFAELVDGKWVEANIKAKEQAQQDYATAVKGGNDAAIASASTQIPAGPGVDPSMTFQIQVFLPPNAERSVRLTYTQVLTGEVGLTRYSYPLSSTALTDERVGDLQVDVKISDSGEIRAVYSPSHRDDVEVTRADKNNAELLYKAQDVSPAQNFDVIYTQSADKFGLNLASYRDADSEDGFFILVTSPQLDAKKDDVIAKDFVFVLDVSGSMQGAKAEQAKAALNKMLDALNPNDRFTVLTFSSGVTPFSPTLVSLDRKAEAQQWVKNFPVEGGTNINDALLTTLDTADKSQPERPHIIVFLTDGQPTVGTTDVQAILENVRAALHPQSRIYTVGVGDVNKGLLDSLAQDNRGTALYLDTTQDLTKPLGAFYAAIDNPVLVDLALDFGGADVYDVYPNPIPDMFLGGQVVVTGRYRKGGPTTVTLTGNINGQKYNSTYKDIKFIDKAADAKPYSFVPRLWAQRKVDALMAQLATGGTDPKIVDQVRELGLKYNIITPYTSFVALPKTGLPFLYQDNYRTANTGLMLAGIALMLCGGLSYLVARRRG